jgi:hypothetical protein
MLAVIVLLFLFIFLGFVFFCFLDYSFLFPRVRAFHDQLSPSFDWVPFRRPELTAQCGTLEKPSAAASSRCCLSNLHNPTNLTNLLLIQSLRKVGLRFAHGNLEVENRERREEVSMKERMTTTMNSLESSPGHLNASIPRRNPFWRSLHQIVGMMLTKSTALGLCVRYSFGHEVRESLTRAPKLDDRAMQQEIQ